MSFTDYVKVRCDGCGRYHLFITTSRRERALKRVREQGWVSPEWGVHYCPPCNERRHET